jgi:hypothetical protein
MSITSRSDGQRSFHSLVGIAASALAAVLFTLVFVLALVPLGLIWRLTGSDPLARRRSNWPGWSPYPARYRNPRHFERMY